MDSGYPLVSSWTSATINSSPSTHDVISVQILSLVPVGFAVSYVPTRSVSLIPCIVTSLKVQYENVLHARSELDVGAINSYSPNIHCMYGMQIKKGVSVGVVVAVVVVGDVVIEVVVGVVVVSVVVGVDVGVGAPSHSPSVVTVVVVLVVTVRVVVVTVTVVVVGGSVVGAAVDGCPCICP